MPNAQMLPSKERLGFLYITGWLTMIFSIYLFLFLFCFFACCNDKTQATLHLHNLFYPPLLLTFGDIELTRLNANQWDTDVVFRIINFLSILSDYSRLIFNAAQQLRKWHRENT